MCTRGQWHLRALTVRYCSFGGSSRGAREYVRTKLADFARENPTVRVATIVARGKHPVLEGIYDSPFKVPRVVDVKNKTVKDIAEHAQWLRDCDGSKVGKFSRPVYTQRPSVQGEWKPIATAKTLGTKPFDVKVA